MLLCGNSGRPILSVCLRSVVFVAEPEQIVNRFYGAVEGAYRCYGLLASFDILLALRV